MRASHLTHTPYHEVAFGGGHTHNILTGIICKGCSLAIMGDEKKNPFSFGGKPKADGAKPNPFGGGAKTGGTPSFTNSFSKKKEGQAAPATGTGTKTTTPFGTKPAAGAKAPPFGTKPAATKPAAAAGEGFKVLCLMCLRATIIKTLTGYTFCVIALGCLE